MARRPANSSPRPAKKGATNKRSPSRSSSGGFHVPGWLWAIIGIIAGFALAQYLREEPSQPDQVAAVVAKPSRSTANSQQPEDGGTQDAQNAENGEQQRAAPEAQMPTFEFYTLLPESEVIAPTVDAYHSTPRPGTEAAIAEQNARAVAQRSNTAPAKTTPKAPTTEQQQHSAPQQADTSGGKLPSYVLQAASFKANGDASKLAGKLKDLGMLAKVTEVKTADGSTWYRVQVGPYQDTRELSRARDLMETQGIEPLLIRQKG